MRRPVLAAIVLVLALAGAAPAAAKPVITKAQCWPTATCLGGPDVVAPKAQIRVTGRGLGAGTRLVFAGRRTTTSDDASVATRPDGPGALLATVPDYAVSGLVALRSGGRWSNPVGPFTVVGSPLPATDTTSAATAGTSTPAVTSAPSAARTPFDGPGMWLWQLSRSGGTAANAAARVRRQHLRVVYVKGADGTTRWTQLNRTLVGRLHAAGASVCSWQYTYGRRPEAEAAAAAASVKASGADCFVIDAEVEYEGHYAAARRYVSALRARLGPSFPIGVAGWPYADYHPAYPLSVFLGPGAATASLPQVYWRAIGTTADAAMVHTWRSNLAYGRALYPIGQTWMGPASATLDRFRGLTETFGGRGYSFWSWQETRAFQWTELATPTGLAQAATPTPFTVGSGGEGDVVVWLQEHLRPSAPGLRITGSFGPGTRSALVSFQTAHGLAGTGRADAATWRALDKVTPYVPRWGAASAASVTGPRTPAAPSSARLPARAHEIPTVGRGGGR